jgi:hypothetical protein
MSDVKRCETCGFSKEVKRVICKPAMEYAIECFLLSELSGIAVKKNHSCNNHRPKQEAEECAY